MSKKVLEQLAGGKTASFSDREAAWNRLGTMTNEALTANEALVAAGLDWEVEKHPIQTVVPTADGVSTIEVDGKFATVRNHKELGLGVLGVVGNRYKVLQNSEAFAFCNNLVDEGGAVFEAAGSLHGGRKVFMTMRLPQEMLIGGHDLINHYLLVTSTHDGTEPMIAAISGVRFQCTNAITATIRNARSQFRIRHSASAEGRIEEARNALQLSWKYEEEFETVANSLLDTKMSDSEFVAFMDKMFEVKNVEDPSKKSVTTNENLKRDLMGLWNADTQASIANTRWAAYNAVVEYADWFAPARGNADIRRAEMLMDGKGQSIKDRTLKALIPA
jgi:phage/plasmid-like protein (TIGR03299 family)